MAKPQQLYNEGAKLYQSAQHREAALVFLQAAEAALAIDDKTMWYKATSWAAEAFRNSGEYSKAMNLLLDLRLNEPPTRPDFEAGITLIQQFWITLDTNPSKTKLTTLLQQLKDFTSNHPSPKANSYLFEGIFFAYQGLFAQALHAFEAGWQNYDNTGYSKDSFAYQAAICCIKLKQFSAAQHWLTALNNIDSIHPQRHLRQVTKIELLIALANTLKNPDSTNTDTSTSTGDQSNLTQLLHHYQQACSVIQGKGNNDDCNEISIRAYLLIQANSELIDPLDRKHPAKQIQTRLLHDKKNVHRRFERHLVLLDLRLAALRFCAHITAVDDYYYTTAQQFSPAAIATSAIDQSSFNQRLQRVLNSCRLTEQYGKKIDDLLECDWRQQEVKARRARIDEIVQYARPYLR